MKRLVPASILLLTAFALMWDSIPRGVSRKAIVTEGPAGDVAHGVIWQPEKPKGVVVIGHGVTSNASVMAAMAKYFAHAGYTAITIDFCGHGRSRERFSWTATPAYVTAWCAWARAHYPGLPLAYLGHSMGGYAGGEAFKTPNRADAFVSLGMLPRETPATKMLIALGAYEELFSPEEARRRFNAGADVAVSPFSDHTLEPWDPLLLKRIVSWLDSALGVAPGPGFPWLGWAMQWLAACAGCAASFMLAQRAAAALRIGDAPPGTAPASSPRRSLNPYRATARLFGYHGTQTAPRAASFPRALAQGILFFLAFILPLSLVLTGHVFTCRPDHPQRWLFWCVILAIVAGPVAFDAWLLERISLPHARGRFAVAALTRGIPLLILAAAIGLFAPRMAFGAMMLVLYAFILVMLALVHALATRATGDYRAGATAAAMTLAWVLAFWFPLPW